MVETVLFSIFHRAPPAPAPAVEREPQAAADTPMPPPEAAPEPQGQAAEPATPDQAKAEPPRLDSVLEALGIHPPAPTEPTPQDEPPASEAGIDDHAELSPNTEAHQPHTHPGPPDSASSKAEPPQTEVLLEALQPQKPPTPVLPAEPHEPEPLEDTPEARHRQRPAWPEPDGDAESEPHQGEPWQPAAWHDADPQPGPAAPDEDPALAAQAEPTAAATHGALVEHQLLGLANPAVFTVRASLGDSDPIDLTTGRAGIYRPVNAQPASWSSSAYGAPSERRTGLTAGTRLLTARGEIPVEDLVPGDVALGLRGPSLLPILWIGRSSTGEPPIRIEAGALGPDRPRRSLCVAADHPVFLDPTPAPAHTLVNGVTIYTADISQAELFHIDVGSPEVLFADGLPVASAERHHANA